jgi:hypothetical protein
LYFSAGYTYVIHAANPKNSDGTVRENVGGDILLGHRVSDSEAAEFLKGDMKYYRRLSVSLTFEPVNQYFITLRILNFNDSSQFENSFKETQTFLKLGIRL